MAVTRDDPYGPFNFLVTISPESGGVFRGGFSECSALNTKISYADYREGTEPFNRLGKIPLMNKAGGVTLKRGLIAAMDLWQWVNQVRIGDIQARATAVIQLRSENSLGVIATWTLLRAIPLKWTRSPTLAAKDSSEVAMEMLVLACEEIAFDGLDAMLFT
jgi:phage tail-like protein